MAYDPNQAQVVQQLNLIIQYLDATTAQITHMIQGLDSMGRTFAESMATLSENMRLIIEVIKKSRANLGDTLDDMSKQINDKIQSLWEEKTIEVITQEQLKAIGKIKELNSIVSDNLYTQQLLSVIQSIRDMIGRSLSIKSGKQ
jgi:ABC-type transporter Mla subunit MlaD